MRASRVARICFPAGLQRRLAFGSGVIVALCALLWSATPVQAQTVYHVDDGVEDGLIAYYKLEETYAGDTIAWDLINEANGTTQGGANFANTNLAPLQGQNFGELDMPGNASDQVLISTPIGFGNEFTVAAWVKRNQINEFHTIFDAGTGSDNEHWYVAIGDGGPKKNAIIFGRRGIPEIIGTTSVTAGEWHHIAVSHSADNTLRMYLDGNLDLTISPITVTVLSGAQRIGAVSVDDNTAIQGNFEGSIDELRLYNRALSSTEIQRLANGFGCVFDGESWATAFGDLQCALEVSTFGDSIRVAKGRYLPGINPAAHFDFQPGDDVQGGFEGNEADNAPRPLVNLNPALQLDFLDSSQYTILTGDLRHDDPTLVLTDPGDIEEADNLHQIFTMVTAVVGTTLDGVVVTGARNDGFDGGGGTLQGSPVIANAIFLYNRADSGGGLDVKVSAGPQMSNLRFIANAANDSGGGIRVQSLVAITDSNFINNAAAVNGGGLAVEDGEAKLANVNFQQNHAPQGGGIYLASNLPDFTYRQGELVANEADKGGALYARSAAILNDLTLRANHALTNGAGIYSDAPLIIDASLLLSNTQAGDTSNLAGGGGLYIRNAFTLTNSTLQGNRAVAGGGIWSISAPTDSTLTNVIIRLNEATSKQGGGMYYCCTGSTVHLENVQVERNSSQEQGGGFTICCGAGIVGQQIIFDHNESIGSGAALDFCCSDAFSTLQAVTFTVNIAHEDGGAIRIGGGADLTVTNGLFLGNEASVKGGGVDAESGADFTMQGGTFEQNKAGGSGGALYGGAIINLTDIQVISNTTTNAGGAGITLDTAFNNSLKQVTFSGNLAGNNSGGALRIINGITALDRVVFADNGAAESGGALSLEEGAKVTATNALLVGNTGSLSDTLQVDDANAIWLGEDSVLRLINSTIAANSGAAPHLFRLDEGSALTMTNSILWDNAPESVSITATAAFSTQHTITGSPTSGVDPRFVRNPDPGDGNWATLDDNDDGDLRLRLDSPALDQGDGALLPAGISQDLDGNARIFDIGFVDNAFAAPVDLGAYEALFVAPTAAPGGPYSGNEDQPIALDGSASSDDNSIVAFAWDCTNDNAFDASSDSPTGQSCTYPDQGQFTLRLRVTDNDGISNTSAISVTVSNVAPVAQDDSATTPEDTAITIDVLANDSDVAADPLTISTAGTPSSGSATIEAGQIRYTPAPDFNGSATFSYTISDGDGGSDDATVTVTVTPVDDPGDKATISLPFLSKEEP